MAERKIQMIVRDAGLASRRQAEALIREGRVTVNGQVVLDPAVTADPERDHIKVDGKLLRLQEPEKFYYLFNKPRNVVSTMRDPEGRPSVGEIIKPIKKKLFIVGRLDFDAEGLMMLTNDGAFAQKMMHPSHRVPRTYLVKVRGMPEDAVVAQIRRGMSIGEGERVGEVSATVITQQKTTTWLKVVLHEGKKHELKRIFFRINHPVRKIRRIGFGPFSLGKLPVGEWRTLTDVEKTKLPALLTAERQGPPPRNRARRQSPKPKKR